MMVNNMSTSVAAQSSFTTQNNTYPAVRKTSKQNDISCASSNSGSSSCGYRHNPYNCQETLVYYRQTQQGVSQNQQCGLSIASGGSNHPRSPNQPLAPIYQGQQMYASYPSPNHYDDQEQYYQSQVQFYDDREQSAFESQRWAAATPVITRQPPHGTLHAQLAGRLNFALYPTVAFESLEPTLPKNQMVRMFIGQLPYNVTEMQLSWIMYAFGGGANMYHFERITKTDHGKGGIKVPTGCFHCHMEAEQVQPLLDLLNDRLLIDDTGIWIAETPEERNLLARYCHGMKVDKTRRFQGRPYGTVVAQRATSTFDPDTFVPARYPTSGFRRH